MHDGVARMRTKDDLRKLLDEVPNPLWVEERLLLATAKFLPQILAAVAKQFAETIAHDAPPPPPGRPQVDFQRKAEVVAFIEKLHMQGTGLERNKNRAAQRFGISESTVQRIWDGRGELGEADFRSALRWVLEG